MFPTGIALTKKQWLISALFLAAALMGIQSNVLRSTVYAETVVPVQENCLNCHQGIEPTSESHPLNLGCTACHGGNGNAEDKDEAHATLIYDPAAKTGKRNPSSLKVVEQSCGRAGCHSQNAEPTLNWADRMRKSPMGTLSGMIGGLRYQWAGQSGKEAKFGIYPVEDLDGTIPKDQGALKQLQALPWFSEKNLRRDKDHGPNTATISHHFADHLLRKSCFGCHLDAPAPAGINRSQGCAACHFTYNNEGTYRGGDPMVSQVETGHPQSHAMTVLPPQSVCVQCHQGFASQPREAFAPQSTGPDRFRLAGSGGGSKDVHLAAGMECIDCHTANDVMGDGNIYSRQYQAVEVRCETCHGTIKEPALTEELQTPNDPTVRQSRHYEGWDNLPGDLLAITARGNKMSNVKKIGEQIITFGKRTGTWFVTPQANNQKTGHNLTAHQNLECTTCHSQNAPRCQGCHITFQTGNPASQNGKPEAFSPYQFHIENQSPRLMVGPRGKITPMLGQSPRTLTILDDQNHPVPVLDRDGTVKGKWLDWKFTNARGYSGSNKAYSAQPHSTGTSVRSCAGCHLDPMTLGLGPGDIEIGRQSSGSSDRIKPLTRNHKISRVSPLEEEIKVTLQGHPLSGASQSNARPFNQKELTRILKVGNCIPCHDRYDDPIYQDIQRSYRLEKQGRHRKLRNRILDQK